MKRNFKELLSVIVAILVISSMILPYNQTAYAVDEAQSKAEDIVSKMTLRQKIAQMIMPDMRSWTDSEGNTSAQTELNESVESAIKKFGFGGVILFDENCVGTQQTAELVCDLQQASASEDSLSQLPMLIAIDQEGGMVTRLSTGTELCGNMALAATNDTNNSKLAGSIIGSELNALGINVDFAPDMDVNNNPANPVINLRSFSDNPEVVSEFGSAFINGLHSQKTISAIKHFPGHGDTVTDSHIGLPSIDKTYEQLKKCELIPFEAGIKANADIVMTAHIQFPKIETDTYTSKSSGEEITLPATLSKKILTDILRNDLGFKGVICTDALNMGAIAEHFSTLDATGYAINAGADLLLMPVRLSSEGEISACENYISGIEQMVADGTIEESRITESAQRIVKLKLDYDVTSQTGADKEAVVKKALATIGSEEHHKTELEIAKKAVTMVKNDNSALPITLKDNDTLEVFCPYSNEINSVKYAVSYLKDNKIIPDSCECSIYCYYGSSADDFAEEVSSATSVIAISEIYSEDELSGSNSDFVENLIDMVHSENGKITVISAQLPYDLARFDKADSLLATYGADGMAEIPTEFNGEVKTYGANIPASICIALGEQVPSGRLPVDIMKLDSDYSYTDEILYKQGYGMISWNGEEPTTEQAEMSATQPIIPSEDREETTNSKDESFMKYVIISSVAVVFVAVVIIISVLIREKRRRRYK